ncbi:DNA mismatch repair protein [Vibrio taketomensis]|uniref:DNA mismatch repair protein n=1 Tax=Vibrio taketomensis TaxID=2572923 RepID=UPI001389AB88|nr:DNA mismatch repair protein [Vibrio taketomensis]
MVTTKLAWPPSWLLVLIGLVLNVLALLMSSIVLERLGQSKASLLEQQQENLYSIQLTWNRVETLERKKEWTILYLQREQEDASTPILDAAFQAQLRAWLSVSIPDLSATNLGSILDLIESAQQSQRDQIDTFYLSNLSLSEQVMALDSQIAWYRNIGLFLQVFGLALILARDLARK